MTPEEALKLEMVKSFDDNIMPDLDGQESYNKAAAEAAKVFGVKKPTFNQLKAYLLFGEDAVDIKEEIRFKEQK